MTMTSSRPTTTASSAPPAPAHRPLPGLWRTSLARSVSELRVFFRNPQSVVFTLALPVILLMIFGSIFSGKIEGTDTDFKQYFVAGIVAAGIMSTAFTGLAINVALEREMGLIRRLAGSPMPKASYFVGKVVLVLVTSLLEALILIALGTALFGLDLPSDADHWIAFGWIFVLGTAACALSGLAYTALIPSANSAAAIVTPPFLVLQFISGVFFPFNQLPEWMQTTAGIFPLKWMTQGLRYVFLPDGFSAVEPGGVWNLPLIAMALGFWVLLAGFLTAITFKWRGPKVR
ncbi:ABC transporter permease [Nostocoides australiense]|uniref:Transport permease protein n=1 Tax=Nostocoides australiense Ben110 TaxID=1193182 RepID=W6JU49_9MICO|nr:ABC transporter permease [Tetrasphaera australiensis]MCA0292050.1 ABC transporter permease [Actinomycetota bacterium]MCB1301218.1 ABC transporter permease [Tetrasphaera sp.]CCH72031.1 ABC-2 type transporter [Tetrasphaera australiensis Ben110]HPF80730.1 ABC transporter permease [Tetrasphaera australiensis]HRW00763.1 ABC transporter permease [Tetrasphaera sp.]